MNVGSMKSFSAPLFMVAALSVSAGCSQYESQSEVEWARSALARNPAFEILATDASAGIFTVRDTVSGEVQTLRIEDLVAAPLPAVKTRLENSSVAPASPAPAVTESAPPMPADAPGVSDESAAAQTTELVQIERTNDGATLAEGPGFSITRGADPAPAAGGTLEGPGYSITRADPATRQSSPDPDAETAAAATERRSDPIICQGDRLMRIDGETLDFTGDALIAEKGCDLYISNARIRAGGVGLIARQARVHIVNSTIGGSRGSYEASDGAEIYVARSTFSGIGRRFDTATMTDLGGNEYELTH
jgi:hypothetical protein